MNEITYGIGHYLELLQTNCNTCVEKSLITYHKCSIFPDTDVDGQTLLERRRYLIKSFLSILLCISISETSLVSFLTQT